MHETLVSNTLCKDVSVTVLTLIVSLETPTQLTIIFVHFYTSYFVRTSDLDSTSLTTRYRVVLV